MLRRLLSPPQQRRSPSLLLPPSSFSSILPLLMLLSPEHALKEPIEEGSGARVLLLLFLPLSSGSPMSLPTGPRTTEGIGGIINVVMVKGRGVGGRGGGEEWREGGELAVAGENGVEGMEDTAVQRYHHTRRREGWRRTRRRRRGREGGSGGTADLDVKHEIARTGPAAGGKGGVGRGGEGGGGGGGEGRGAIEVVVQPFEVLGVDAPFARVLREEIWVDWCVGREEGGREGGR